MYADLSDLTGDLRKIAVRAKRDMAVVVRNNARRGNSLARAHARRTSGPHGKAYFKRITAEAKTLLRWEYGPEGIPKTEFVGAGYRHGPPNHDLANSLDVQGPKFVADVRALPDKWFWPES